MNIINKFTLTSLKLNKKRTIVTIIGIILSCAMICGVATLTTSFQDLFIQLAIETDGNYHAEFLNVKYENSKYISENPFSKETMFRRNLGYSIIQHDSIEGNIHIDIQEYDSIAFKNMSINLKEGRFPEKDGEIVISEGDKTGDVKFEIGQAITLELYNLSDESSGSSVTKTYTVTGIISNFSTYKTPTFEVVAYLDKNTLNADDKINISILARNPRKIYEKAPEISENAHAEKISYNGELLRYLGVSNNVGFNNMLWSIGLILIALIVVGSVTVIYNAFAISVGERKKQFGMLLSIGATPEQIRKGVFFEGVVLGIIGIPAGIISGILGIFITIKVVNTYLAEILSIFYNIELKLVVYPITILVTLVFICLVIFLSAYIPAKRASRISPIETIRQNKDINIKGKKLRTSKLTRFIFGIEGELALKYLKRNRKRYRATVFSIAISIVLFIFFSAFMKYGMHSSEMYFRKNAPDILVEVQDVPIEEQNILFDEISNFEGVDRCSIVRSIDSATYFEKSKYSSFLQNNIINQGAFEVNKEGLYKMTFNILALGEKEFEAYIKENKLDIARYKDTLNPKGILINKNLYKEGALVEYRPLNIKSGEKVYLTEFPHGEEHSPLNYNIEIGAIIDNIPFSVLYSEVSSVNMIVSEEVYDSIFAMLHDNNRSKPILMGIKTEDSRSLTQKVEDFTQKNQHSISVFDIATTMKTLRSVQIVMSIFLYGFLILISLIGITNIFNTISTNVSLRRREFAMLKSIGLTPKGFNKMMNYESIFYGLKALLYGLPLGIALSIVLYNSFSNLFEFRFILPLTEMIICIAAVFSIVFITMLYSSSKFKKENIIDALREENI